MINEYSMKWNSPYDLGTFLTRTERAKIRLTFFALFRGRKSEKVITSTA